VIRLLNVYFPRRTLLLGISEACLVATAFVLAAIARLGVTDASVMLNYEQGAFKIFVVSVILIGCMYYFDLYDSLILSNKREVLTRLIQVLGVACILLAVIYYAYPSLQIGRGIFAIGLCFVAVFLLLWRRLFSAVNSRAQFAERVLIFGNGPLADSLAAELSARPELGIRVVGQLNGKNPPVEHADSIEEEKSNAEFLHLVDTYRAERIVVALNERRGVLPVTALLQLKSRGVRIQDSAQMYEAVTGKLPIESLRLSWLLFSRGFEVSRGLLAYQRISSVIWSTVGVLLTFPLMALIALAIRLDSEGPVVFRQKRVGQNGETFTLFKFRTTINGADLGEIRRPAEGMDSPFTRVGKFLWRTRMDELPQLFNILRGDMHFVGPRPFVPHQEKQCSESIPFYSQRWAVKPGVTGWAQVNRGYHVTREDHKDELAYDLFYIKNISVGLDLLILFQTAKTATGRSRTLGTTSENITKLHFYRNGR
jgi:exopolysaccharide biosynthesis polyprenyl glycosylphosphotransferase